MSNFFDSTQTISPVGAGGVITQINKIPEGFTDSNRIGARVRNTHLLVNQILQNVNQSSVTDVGDTIRTIIFWDTQSNLGAPAVADVLQSASITSFWNWDNQERFVIISDTFCDAPVMTQDAALGSAENTYSETYDVNLAGAITTYTQGTTNINTNSLNILDISFNAACSLSRTCRLIYEELE